MTMGINGRASRFFGVMAGAIFMLGCGRSEYESRVESGMAGARVKQTFSVISPTPIEFPGTPLTIRLPRFIDASSKAYTEDSAGPGGQGKVDPNRVQPPFLKLPGLRVTYEMQGMVQDAAYQTNYYCYLAAVPAGALAADGKSLEDSIQAQLAAAFAAQPQWQNASCPTEAGPKVDWRHITATGAQPFFDQMSEAKPLAGTFELYAKEIDGLQVLIGWRYPQKLTENISGTAQLVAGSVVAAAGGAGNPPAAD